MHTVTLEEAKAHLDELIQEAGAGGEIVITRDEKPIARLSAPSRETRRWAAFGLLKGEIEMAPDFDAPLEDFRPYME